MEHRWGLLPGAQVGLLPGAQVEVTPRSTGGVAPWSTGKDHGWLQGSCGTVKSTSMGDGLQRDASLGPPSVHFPPMCCSPPEVMCSW